MINGKKTLALFSPGNDGYSETFIRAHKTLPFNIKHYYGGYFPTELEGNKSLIDFTIAEKIEKKMKRHFNLRQFALYCSLKREKVDGVLAEYGVTAAKRCPSLQNCNYRLLCTFTDSMQAFMT